MRHRATQKEDDTISSSSPLARIRQLKRKALAEPGSLNEEPFSDTPSKNTVVSAQDGEDDYMSITFLQPRTEDSASESSANKPGSAPAQQLLYSERRKRALREAEMRGRKESRAQRDRDSLAKHLAKKIDESNVGLKLLCKMGFKEGTALGPTECDTAPPAAKSGLSSASSQAAGGRLIEPLPVLLPRGSDRLGLGAISRKEEDGKRLDLTSEELESQKAGFRDMRAEIFAERTVAYDVRMCRKLCYELDNNLEHQVNVRESDTHYWPLRVQPNATKIKDPEEIDGFSQRPPRLNKITGGDKTDEFGSLDCDDDYFPPTEASRLFEMHPPNKQLALLLDYIRKVHSYCYYCGSRYESENELNEFCPGFSREEH